MKSILKYKYILFTLLLFIVSCNIKQEQKEENKDFLPVLVTAKYSYYSVYPKSYYFPGSDTTGVNIYFAGNITNYTSDTIYIPNKAMGFNDPLVDPLEESLFYSIINGDSLYFLSYYPRIRIKPSGNATINLQRHITPNETKWMAVFKDIGKDHKILDTMKIYYASPNLKLDKIGKILPAIAFERSTKFRVDTTKYNSYFENIFKMREYYENPPKEYLEDN